MAQNYRTLSSAAVLNSTGVSAGSYGSGSLVPVITVGADGRITAVTTSAVSGGGGGASVVVSDTAPVSPSVGNIWFNSSKLNTYIYYNDGDSSQWVNATSVNVGSIILPTQTGNSGKFLSTDGTNITWSTVSALPSQTSNAGKYLTTDGTSASWGTVSSVVVSDTAPASPASGNIWLDTSGLNTYVYYSDGDSSQWVSAGSAASVGYTGSRGTDGVVGYNGSVGYTGSAAAGGGTPAAVSNQQNTSTGAFGLPVGTTAQRPSPAYNGYYRVNTTTNYVEMYYNSAWYNIQYIGTITATGGTVTPVGNYKVHTFTSSGTFTITSMPPGGVADILVVAGGGAGGWDVGGGGGAGGVIYTLDYTGFTATSYAITIGGGGVASSSGSGTAGSGSNTTLGTTPPLTAIGGGGGGNYQNGSGGAGGSGGGGSGYGSTTTGGSGTASQGNKGGDSVAAYGTAATGGGGGGYGSAGSPSASNNSGFAAGGAGLVLAWDGNTVTYAAGGRGSGDNWTGMTAAVVNSGSGGDGSGAPNTGINGASGIVMIRYRYQ